LLSAVRPTGVTILAILEIISGIIAIAAGLLIATISSVIGIEFGAIGGIISAIVIALGVASFVMAWGLLQGKSWAWTFTLVLTIISLIFDLAGVNLVGLIIEGVILYYLFRPNVKAFFGKSEKML